MFKLPDGTTIDIGYSGRPAGPGHTGQQVSRNYLWYRVNGGEWQSGERFRTAHKLLEWCQMCESLEDFNTL